MSLATLQFALAYLSWYLLCLGLPRHYLLHFGTAPKPWLARAMRAAGWLLALAGLLLGLHQPQPDIGAVLWCCCWMLSAVLWVLLQPFRPRLARLLAPSLILLAALALLL